MLRVRSLSLVDGGLLALTVCVAYALKLHYSVASVDELVWVLKPTAWLVQTLTGHAFVYEAHAGYVSTKLLYVIASSCAGVNFLIVVFCTAMFGFVRGVLGVGSKVVFFGAAAVVAYVATIVVNTIRILIALPLHTQSISYGWFTPQRVHRFEGIAVYFVCLCVLFVVARKHLTQDSHAR